MADKAGEKEGCCGSGCHCCGGKAVKTLVLLLIGGIIGYLLGGHCAFKKGCPMMGGTMSGAPMSAPAAMPKK
jgi:hypothetical protein